MYRNITWLSSLVILYWEPGASCSSRRVSQLFVVIHCFPHPAGIKDKADNNMNFCTLSLQISQAYRIFDAAKSNRKDYIISRRDRKTAIYTRRRPIWLVCQEPGREYKMPDVNQPPASGQWGGLIWGDGWKLRRGEHSRKVEGPSQGSGQPTNYAHSLDAVPIRTRPRWIHPFE